MKLGVSYNVFDGEELLEGSIKQIRSEVDFISVVYQTTSNLGNSCDQGLIPLLKKLVEEKLIDACVHYEPVKEYPHYNEIKKRNIGLELSKNNNCTHHMSMDTDEYYDLEQFKNLKKVIIDGNYDSSYCQMITYYKSWEYRIDPLEDYYVSLIFKINEKSMYDFMSNTPVLVDPTRKMNNTKNPLILSREKLQMHHGSYIRNDIEKKLKNSSSKNNNWDIEKIKNHYDSFKEGDKALMFKPFEEYVNLIKVEKMF